MRSKLIITRFYLRNNLVVCFDKAPDIYDESRIKALYGWMLFLGELGPAAPTSWNWLETKLINNSEYVLERGIFA